jgi:hypothetical protein
MSKFSYEKLLNALDLHQNILHAEKQAISARDLDTVEDILLQKDSSLELVLAAKNEVDSKFPVFVSDRISSVMNQQRQNTLDFKKLHIQDQNNPTTTGEKNPLFKRLKRAYQK